MIQAAEVVAEARSWLGVSFLHQGRSRRGVDCIGLLVVVCRALGLADDAPDVRDYAMNPSGWRMLAGLDAYLERVTTVEPGVILAFNLMGKDAAGTHHVAIAAAVDAYPTVIHSHSRLGKRVVEHRLAGFLLSKVTAIYRIPGVAY